MKLHKVSAEQNDLMGLGGNGNRRALSMRLLPIDRSFESNWSLPVALDRDHSAELSLHSFY
jgi:hypothetical protein